MQRVDDGNDLEALDGAIDAAQAETERPSLIVVRTHIGFGSPNKQDTAKAHGAPLGEDEIRLTKENLGWPREPFFVPDEALDALARDGGTAAPRRTPRGSERFDAYARRRTRSWRPSCERRLRGELPGGLGRRAPDVRPPRTAAWPRAASGMVLNALAPSSRS